MIWWSCFLERKLRRQPWTNEADFTLLNTCTSEIFGSFTWNFEKCNGCFNLEKRLYNLEKTLFKKERQPKLQKKKNIGAAVFVFQVPKTRKSRENSYSALKWCVKLNLFHVHHLMSMLGNVIIKSSWWSCLTINIESKLLSDEKMSK